MSPQVISVRVAYYMVISIAAYLYDYDQVISLAGSKYPSILKLEKNHNNI